MASLSPIERDRIARVEAFMREEFGYISIQSTRPQTLAYGLVDSPVGQLAWIMDKFMAWTWPAETLPDAIIGKDRLLTNVMIYWLTGSIGSSMQYYWAHRHAPPVALRPERIEVPTGVALFPKEVTRPPRSAVERKYALTRWTEMPRGGHFPALEAPDDLAHELRAFFRPLRVAG